MAKCTRSSRQESVVMFTLFKSILGNIDLSLMVPGRLYGSTQVKARPSLLGYRWAAGSTTLPSVWSVSPLLRVGACALDDYLCI